MISYLAYVVVSVDGILRGSYLGSYLGLNSGLHPSYLPPSHQLPRPAPARPRRRARHWRAPAPGAFHTRVHCGGASKPRGTFKPDWRQRFLIKTLSGIVDMSGVLLFRLLCDERDNGGLAIAIILIPIWRLYPWRPLINKFPRGLRLLGHSPIHTQIHRHSHTELACLFVA